MKKYFPLIVTILAVLMIASPAWAQKAGVIGTVHDVGGNGCLSCHAPHNGSEPNTGINTLATQGTGRILLWARDFTTQTFGTYSSPTLNNTTAEIGTTTPAPTDARLYSFLCMSCHDGVTTPSLIAATDPHAIGNPTNSYGLQNDHPVNMNYDPLLDNGLDTAANVKTAGLKLFGVSDTVQCASCHNVHNNTNAPFLRVSNAGSGLCLTCHL